MPEPRDMVIPLLRDIRDQMDRNHREVTARLDKIESSQASFKRALTADTVLARLVVGEFEERISSLEKTVAEIMKDSD